MFLLEKSVLLHFLNFLLMLVLAGFTLRAIEGLLADKPLGQALAWIY